MIDEHSETWRAVRDWAERGMVRSRASLESLATSPEQTNYERGRLAAMKELLRLAEPQTIHRPDPAIDAG